MYNTTRRKFLQQSALISSGLMIPGFLKAFDGRTPGADAFRRIVIIQLSGGNDGLNTLVPFENDHYYRNRRGLAIPANEVIKLEKGMGFNPALGPLMRHWEKGRINAVNNVGYPNPDRSHFRSMDIWHTASDSDTYLQNGWLGRYMDHNCEGAPTGESCTAPVLSMDDNLNLALKGVRQNGLASSDPRRLYRTTSDPWFETLSKKNPDSDNNRLSFLYKTLAGTVSSAEYVYSHFEDSKTRATFPTSPFAKQLQTTAALIRSGIQTSVYYVSLSGFDTHIRQKPTQNRLLKTYAEAVSAFLDDLDQAGELDNTLVLTFSEFGRRVKQNASGGTDHGAANIVLLMGGKLKNPGIFNEGPDLAKLDRGDLQHSVDFRTIYATLLDNWLETDSGIVLGKSFDTLNLV